MNMSFLEIEDVDDAVRITCDRMSAQSVRQALVRHGISITPENELVCSLESPRSKDGLRDLIEFYAQDCDRAEVDFALQDMVKMARPYPRK